MASEREVLQILIQTVADLKAAEQTRASLDKTRDTLRSAGKDTAALDAQIKAELDAISAASDAATETLEPIIVKPKKTNLTPKLVALVWTK